MNKQYRGRLYLVNLANDDFTNDILVLIKRNFLFDFPYLLVEILFKIEHEPSAEIIDRHFLHIIIAHIEIFTRLLFCAGRIYFCIRVNDLFYDRLIQENLYITLFHIHNYIEIGFRSVFLFHHLSERILDNTFQNIPIDILFFSHHRKGFY